METFRNETWRFQSGTRSFHLGPRKSARHWKVSQEVNGLGKLSRADAKAVEQVLIEKYGLLKNGGILTNRINSIAVSNPTYASSLIRGAELLRRIGFPGF